VPWTPSPRCATPSAQRTRTTAPARPMRRTPRVRALRPVSSATACMPSTAGARAGRAALRARCVLHPIQSALDSV
jgi:hypothetical protein